MKKFWQTLGIIALCLIIFGCVVFIQAARLDAYNGDVGCLMPGVRCVKVIH